MREKVGKSRNTVFFQWFVAPEGRKVGSLKRRVRSQLARWVMKNCTPLWREAHFEVKMYKTHQCRTTFGSWDVKKVHAVVARSTFPSQNVQNTPVSDHFWKLRCRKSARRCGAKHISKSKCTKHTRFGPLLEVEMSKKCTPLWREAHFQVKMYKTHQFGPLLEVQMSKKCTPLWREAHFQVKMYKTPHVRATFGGSDVEKVHAVVARSTFQVKMLQNYQMGSRPLLEVQMSLRFTRHYTTLHYTPLHYNYTQLHYTTLHYTQLHSTTLHYITLHYTTFHYTSLHYITTTLHYTRPTTTTTQLHSTTLHYTNLHYITLHYTPLHYHTLHYTPLHTTWH